MVFFAACVRVVEEAKNSRHNQPDCDNGLATQRKPLNKALDTSGKSFYFSEGWWKKCCTLHALVGHFA